MHVIGHPEVPYVTGVREEGAFQFPDDREAVFDIGFHLEVARLARNEEVFGPGLYAARTQGAGLPAAHAVRPAGVELFLERDGGGVAITVAGAHQEAQRHRLGVGADHAAPPQPVLALKDGPLGEQAVQNGRELVHISPAVVPHIEDQGGGPCLHKSVHSGVELLGGAVVEVFQSHIAHATV